jgi:uncharacterized Zn finger protein (UPF0148 family)
MESSASGPPSTADSPRECRACGEINQPGTVACARCGATLLSADEMKQRRAQIERWKREAERESVDYPTTASALLDRFSGKPRSGVKYFSSISNYRKRVGVLCALVPVVIVVLILATRGH